MDRSPRGNDIITLRFFDFRNSRKVMTFFKIRQHANMLCFPVVFGVLFCPESVNRKNATANQYFITLSQKSANVTPVQLILGQNGVKWR